MILQTEHVSFLLSLISKAVFRFYEKPHSLLFLVLKYSLQKDVQKHRLIFYRQSIWSNNDTRVSYSNYGNTEN